MVTFISYGHRNKIIVKDIEDLGKIKSIFDRIKPLLDPLKPVCVSCWEYSKFNEKFGSVLEEDELEILREFVAIDRYGNGYFDNVDCFIGKPIKMI